MKIGEFENVGRVEEVAEFLAALVKLYRHA